MNTQWELYFLRREIERQKIQKQRKKKRRWYGIINTTSKAKPDEIVTIPLEEYMKSLSNNNLQ